MYSTSTARTLSQEMVSFSRPKIFCTNSSATFAAAWTVSSLIMAFSTLDAKPQIGVPSMVWRTTKMDADMAWRRVFRRIPVLLTASWWSHPCLVAVWRTHIVVVHSTLPCLLIAWTDSIVSHCIYVSVTYCFHWLSFEQWLEYLICVKPSDSTLYSNLVKRYVSAILCTTACCLYCTDLPWSTAAGLASTFSRSLTNGKRLMNGILEAGSLPCASYCGRWTLAFCWSCMGSCTHTCYPIFIWHYLQLYRCCYCCHRWVLVSQDLCFKI